MNRLVSIASAALVCAAGATSFVSPTLAANFQQRDQFIGNFCNTHPSANQCNSWKQNHSHWGNSDYQSFYRYNQNSFGTNVAAGLFGFAVGAAVASSVGNHSSAHISACQSAYRSYSVQSDTYLGYDGVRHQCQL